MSPSLSLRLAIMKKKKKLSQKEFRRRCVAERQNGFHALPNNQLIIIVMTSREQGLSDPDLYEIQAI